MEKDKYLKVKRFLDIVLSLSGLIVLAPVFLVLIAAIKADSPGAAMFTLPITRLPICWKIRSGTSPGWEDFYERPPWMSCLS